MTEGRVLLQDLVERILSKETRSDKVGEFLTYLTRRGPHAMKIFIAALIQTDQVRQSA